MGDDRVSIELTKAQARHDLAVAQARLDQLLARGENIGEDWDAAKARRDLLQARVAELSISDLPPPPPPPASSQSIIEAKLVAEGLLQPLANNVIRKLMEYDFDTLEVIASIQASDLDTMQISDAKVRAAIIAVRDKFVAEHGVPSAAEAARRNKRRKKSGKGKDDDSDLSFTIEDGDNGGEDGKKKSRPKKKVPPPAAAAAAAAEAATAAAAAASAPGVGGAVPEAAPGVAGDDASKQKQKPKKDSGRESKSQRTVYMRMKWPDVAFARDCTFGTLQRKAQAKAIWDEIKVSLKAPKSVEEVTQALIAKGLRELEESKGYSWDEHHKAWQIKIWYGGELVHFGYLKSQELAAEAGRALLKKRTSMPRTESTQLFRSMGSTIFQDFKTQDVSSGNGVPDKPVANLAPAQ